MLLCVSASHQTAPFEILEQLSRAPHDVARQLTASAPCIQGAVVVATCNRFEVYLDVDEPATAGDVIGVEAVMRAVTDHTGLARHAVEGLYEVHRGSDVAEHLFAVASGLKSVVSGEEEIAGQVRRALSDARDNATTSSALEHLFQQASRAQRRVKNVTALSRAGRSLVRLALDLADSRISDWSAEQVVLVGTGAYAAVTLAALRERGAETISVYSPSGRAQQFAEKHNLTAITEDAFVTTARQATLLVTCTNAEGYVVTGEHVHDAPHAGTRPSRLVIDLGMPRNVDPAVTQNEGVALLDLETIRLHAPLEELQAAEAARSVVREAAADFRHDRARRAVAPAIVALRSHVFSLLEAEIARARARDDDGSIEQALRHLVGVLLHTPTTRAHELAARGQAAQFAEAVHTLLGVSEHLDTATAQRSA
ncbi:glutamyl-tRNA reductase [Microbacterium sp. YY-01]|uniref:glutamyl-tRNA reductase n=1 Tax=Microbacterium sp. YY-01 TaxID=3421634 RepID=UPI003D16F41A